MKIIKIGRNPDNDIVISDKSTTVSGYHAVLKVDNNGNISLCDSSTNGTFINGVKAPKGADVAIKKGDEIRFGPFVLLDWGFVVFPSTLSDATRMGSDATRMVADDKETYSIGTAADNRIVLPDASNHVSRHHAIIKKRYDGSFYIYDQSTNGTYINGVKIKTKQDVPVSTNDKVLFANVVQLNWSLLGVPKPAASSYEASYTPQPQPKAAPNPPSQTSAPEMFSEPFSFEGRIRRLEYGISSIIYAVIAIFINYKVADDYSQRWIYIAFIPMMWFMIAQNTKRCHDLGNSGWYQLIPFYGFWLLFADSNSGSNEYGRNPKNGN